MNMPAQPSSDAASTTDDRQRGLYPKYGRVTRTDGGSVIGGKHHSCRYFVLDVEHDPFAGPALRTYAEVCRADYPLLAADITAQLDTPAKAAR